MEQRLRELEAKQKRREIERQAERKAAEQQKLKRKKKRMRVMIPVIAVLFVATGLFAIKQVGHPEYVVAPVNDSDAFEGVNYKDVRKKFTDLGFRNIQMKPLNDISDKDDPDLDKVTTVTIRGEDTFVEYHLLANNELKQYQWDDVVIITYHSMK